MIRLSKSVVGKAESEAVAHVIEDIGYLGMGETVGTFEKELQDYVGGGYRCICVNSGTAALHLAVQAVTRPGDEVLVPSFTFVSTYQAITGAGCVPVSCEINPDTLTLDLDDAARRITPRTTAMLPVYYASNIAMVDEYQAFARMSTICASWRMPHTLSALPTTERR
jgi:dTDP-4-amino-4,6-dideoxygalactose transaminase